MHTAETAVNAVQDILDDLGQQRELVTNVDETAQSDAVQYHLDVIDIGQSDKS